MFKVSYDAVCDWIKRYKTTSDYSSKQGVGCGRTPGYSDKQAILDYLKDNLDANGIQIRDALIPEMPMNTFYDTLKRLKINIKKEPKYKQRSEPKREAFLDQVKSIDIEKLYYIE